jgi:hypothetical protein
MVQGSLQPAANPSAKTGPMSYQWQQPDTSVGTAPLSCARAISSSRNAPAEALHWRWNHPILAELLPSTSILALESKASTKRPVFHPFADHFGERERRVSPARSVSEEGVSLHLQGQASAAFNASRRSGRSTLSSGERVSDPSPPEEVLQSDQPPIALCLTRRRNA